MSNAWEIISIKSAVCGFWVLSCTRKSTLGKTINHVTDCKFRGFVALTS